MGKLVSPYTTFHEKPYLCFIKVGVKLHGVEDTDVIADLHTIYVTFGSRDHRTCIDRLIKF